MGIVQDAVLPEVGVLPSYYTSLTSGETWNSAASAARWKLRAVSALPPGVSAVVVNFVIPVRILIIDDEKSVRSALTAALESMRHQVTTAANGALALHALRHNDFEVVLLDMRLSEESGLELLDEILTISPRIAVILVTAYATVETAVSAVKRGAFDCLQKPCTPEQLRQLLERVEQTRKLENRVAELESDAAHSITS
jgi:NtrC-family two-component system response regulator AlgB